MNPGRVEDQGTLPMRHLFQRAGSMLADQADGLRRLFGAAPRRQALVAVASNPHVPCAGVLLERLTSAFAAAGRHTLVVDASEAAPAASEAVVEDPALGIEPLGDGLSYLAARGLALRHLDTQGSAATLLLRLQEAARTADVVLVHAGAGELSRLFDGRELHPVVLAGESADSLPHALASLRLLAARHRCRQFDLLLGVAPRSPLAAHHLRHLAGCARHKLDAVLREGVALDPAADVPPPPALARLAAALLETEPQEEGKSWHPGGPVAARAATHPVRN